MNLRREIKRWDLIALIINGVIGAGIFGLPSKIYDLVQSYSWLVVISCGVLIGFIVMSFAEVSSRFSSTGGPYLYAYKAFGKIIGFEMGWLLWLTRISAFGAVCNLLISYLAFLAPDVLLPHWQYLIIAGLIGLLTVINLLGIKQSIQFSNLFTIIKLIPLLLFIFVGIVFINVDKLQFNTTFDQGSFSSGIMVMVFAFGGFELSTISAGEIRNPRKIFPPSLFFSLLLITLMYVLIQIVCIGTLPNLSQSGSPLADAASEFSGAPGGLIISVGALISMVGALNATFIACTRLPFAMAENRQIPEIFAAIHHRYQTPHISVLISSIAILAFTFAYSFMDAVRIHVIIKLITYAFVCISLPVFRYSNDIPDAKFKVRGGIVISLISVLICFWLVSSTSLKEALNVGVAVGIGILLYVLFTLFPGKENAK